LEVVDKTSKYQKSIFVRNLIARRKKLGMSALEFAEFADIKYPTLRDIEHGSSPGSSRTKEKIASALGTTVDQLNIPNEAPATSDAKSQLILKIITGLTTLNDIQLSGILDIVERGNRDKPLAAPANTTVPQFKHKGK
jgi:transcriptional regulator with XRE-family HTH domain